MQSYPPQQGYPSYPAPAGFSQASYPPYTGQTYPPAGFGGQTYPPSTQAYPPAQAYPPTTPSYPPATQPYPQGNQGYPPSNPGPKPAGYPQTYGSSAPSYPPAAPSYPPQQSYGQPPYAGPAVQTPIVDRMYCKTTEQVFLISENVLSVSGDDFKITDVNNSSNSFKLDSAAFSMKGSRVLRDSAGRKVLNMRHKVMSGKRWYIRRGESSDDSNLIAQVQRPSNWYSGQTPRLEIFLKGNSSHHFSAARPDFTGHGDARGKGFMIYRGQQPIAEISRKLAHESGKQRVAGKDSYALRVFPGQDAAFLIAVCTIIDELFYD